MFVTRSQLDFALSCHNWSGFPWHLQLRFICRNVQNFCKLGSFRTINVIGISIKIILKNLRQLEFFGNSGAFIQASIIGPRGWL